MKAVLTVWAAWMAFWIGLVLCAVAGGDLFQVVMSVLFAFGWLAYGLWAYRYVKENTGD